MYILESGHAIKAEPAPCLIYNYIKRHIMGRNLNVRLNYLPVINFAMQQNHVPVVRDISIKNSGNESIQDLDIILSFEPEFAVEFTSRIDRIEAGEEKKIAVVPISMSTEYLSNLTERMSGNIRVTARKGEDVLYEKNNEITILTFNEWGGTGVMPEMLAAFSTPNHPEVALIKKRASQILAKWTGTPSLNAYQERDPNRVKYQMAAIYEAILEKAVTYCVAPSSFEARGQRIRLVDEIMSMKMGNCLDMTMLYVSCLESIGLHPLVMLTSGHAFAGCWLINDSFADCSNDDASLITKRMADGMNEILVVECTAMNEGSRADFDSACAAAKQKLLTSEDFEMFIDVSRARVAQIRPLPLRVVDADGRYVVEDREVNRNEDAPTDMSATDLVIDKDAEVSKKTIWERKLLDLSLRNTLLNLKITRGTIPIIVSDINALEDSLASNVDFKICPRPAEWDCDLSSDGLYKTIHATDPKFDFIQQELPQNRLRTYFDESHLSSSLTHLYRSAKLSMEENGANTLYLALGLLKWYETPASLKPRYAPILLVPVELVRKSAASGYILRSRDEDPMLNITLLELLRQMFDITIGGLDPLPKDKCGVDTSLIFNTIRRKIMEQKNWDVVEQAVLGNFSFNKFIMWNDIHSHSDILCESPIVSSMMSGVVEKGINTDITEEQDLDGKFKAGDIALPLSADSSQIEAITAALGGKSFVLHGPPGTGKSQTITNIIANALYCGKRVLFVAEKMAALEVVQNRLNSIGLGPFCLELHSNKAKKSNVLEQLKRTTEVVKKKSAEEYRIEAEHINEVRDEMNSYIKALHKPYPLGVSLYDCISGYVAIDEGISCFDVPMSKVAGLTSDKVSGMKVALSDLKAALGIVGNPANNPLRGIGSLEYNADIESALAGLPEVLSGVEALDEKLRSLLEKVLNSEGDALSVDDCAFLLKLCAALQEKVSYPGLLTESMSSIGEIKGLLKHGRLRDKLRTAILKDCDDSILDIDVKAYEAEWREVLSNGLLSRLFAARKYLRKLSTYSRRPVASEHVFDLLRQIASYQKEDASVKEMTGRYGADWDEIEKSCDVAEKIRSVVNDYVQEQFRREEILSAVSAVLANEDCQMLGDILKMSDDLGIRLVALQEKLCSQDISLAGGSIGDLKETLSRWYAARGKVRSWVLYNKQKAAVRNLGFPEIVDQVDTGIYAPESIVAAFQKTVYKIYAEHILTQEQDLQLFHGSMFEEKIRRFRGLCQDFETLTKDELFAKVASYLPALQSEASNSSEVGILQRNIRNGCRGVSLRNFFASIPDLLHRMCPCMLMSPISVAQYIEADSAKFDLVIFDEASQMPTCEAVGAIARGKSIIVVGDPNQLPPTTFFDCNVYDEDNAHIEDLESVLDDCLALSLPSKHLRWHYRSRHESLISFSNVRYYDGKLHTFPSPDDLETKIRYQHVDGVYERGGSRQNKAEAAAVIQEIKRRLEDPALSKMSIGVVTFNSNQQSLLEDMLNDLFVKNPDLEQIALENKEPIFIKNLENVQGDERDVILFSIGYGQDKQGKITLNFGPLNRDGGWRRLNVAVSRARYEMMVFSTLKSDQIDLKRTSAEGVVGLKDFLEYAESGKMLEHGRLSGGSQDGVVEDVARAIRERGYQVKTNLGSSGFKVDIGVVNPDNDSSYALGILCDGYNYMSSRSARDREIVQVNVLKDLGWKVVRVWAMDWWTNRDGVIAELISKIEEAISGEYEEESYALEEPVRACEEPDCDEVVSCAENIVPYEFTILETISPQVEDVIAGYYDICIKELVKQVIRTEAPITKELLCKRVLRSLNISRMGPRVALRMQTILEGLDLKKTVDVGDVYWTDEQIPEEYQLIRSSNEREAMYIPFEEAKNAAIHVLDQQGAQPMDSLIREMSKLFGYSRVGDNVYMAMMQGIDLAARRSLIDKTVGRISLKV